MQEIDFVVYTVEQNPSSSQIKVQKRTKMVEDMQEYEAKLA